MTVADIVWQELEKQHNEIKRLRPDYKIWEYIRENPIGIHSIDYLVRKGARYCNKNFPFMVLFIMAIEYLS